MGEAAFGADAALNFRSEAGKPKAGFVAQAAYRLLSQEGRRAVPAMQGQLLWEGVRPVGQNTLTQGMAGAALWSGQRGREAGSPALPLVPA